MPALMIQEKATCRHHPSVIAPEDLEDLKRTHSDKSPSSAAPTTDNNDFGPAHITTEPLDQTRLPSPPIVREDTLDRSIARSIVKHTLDLSVVGSPWSNQFDHLLLGTRTAAPAHHRTSSGMWTPCMPRHARKCRRALRVPDRPLPEKTAQHTTTLSIYSGCRTCSLGRTLGIVKSSREPRTTQEDASLRFRSFRFIARYPVPTSRTFAVSLTIIQGEPIFSRRLYRYMNTYYFLVFPDDTSCQTQCVRTPTKWDCFPESFQSSPRTGPTKWNNQAMPTPSLCLAEKKRRGRSVLQ